MKTYHLIAVLAAMSLSACGNSDTAGTPGQGLADISTSTICQLTDMVARGDHQPAETIPDCTVSVDGDIVTVSGLSNSDGDAVDVSALRITAPRTVVLDESILGTMAVQGPREGLWQNVHAAFIVSAPEATAMCMAVENFSPNGQTNSIYVFTGSYLEAKPLGLTIDEESIRRTTYREVLVQPGETQVVTLLAREPEAAIRSVDFVECDG